MRKVYCIRCGRSMDVELYFLDFEDSIKRLQESFNKPFSEIAIYLFKEFFMCYGCIVEMMIDMERLTKEGTEKCTHCGKSLAGMAILLTHVTRAGKYCSQECYGKANDTKKEN